MIELKNITKYYITNKKKNYIFKNFSLLIPSKKNIALIGSNGVGKSTLIKILGGTEQQNSGEILTSNSISWPLGLSGGFQGSLTGRENIKFAARLFSKASDIKNIVNYVEEFSELGDYFDMPIRTYSSGMKSRLSFGLSMSFDFDYYLVDEIISVGDLSFREKCSIAFKQKQEKSNVIMVSHSNDILRRYCDCAINIVRGKSPQYYDDIDEAIYFYKNKQNH